MNLKFQFTKDNFQELICICKKTAKGKVLEFPCIATERGYHAQIKCNVTNSSIPQDPQKETTKEFYSTCNLPTRWDRPYWFNGYGSQQVPLPNPFYRSTYMDYGWYPPNIHTVPVSFYPSKQRFTNNLGICGMYRNSSLNTCLDSKRIGE